MNSFNKIKEQEKDFCGCKPSVKKVIIGPEQLNWKMRADSYYCEVRCTVRLF